MKGNAGQGVEHIEVTLDTTGGESHEKTGHDGAAVFPEVRNARQVTFHVPVYDVDAGPFPLDAARNEKDEHLQIKGGSLEMKFFDSGKPMVYRRS